MLPTKRSHVKEPYYVEVVYADEKSFTLSLPKHHTLNIEYDTPTHEYHEKRMTIIGSKEDFGYLLCDQKLKYKK